MNQAKRSRNKGNSFPAPDFNRRLERYPGPDDSSWWRLWMSGYAIPSVYTARRAGVLSACEKQVRSPEEVSESCNISRRAARVLMNNLGSLGLLEVRNGCFQSTKTAVTRFGIDGDREWSDWLDEHYEYPVTPGRLYDYVSGVDEITFPQPPADAVGGARHLVNLPWAFPATVTADRLGLLKILASAGGVAPTTEMIYRDLANAGELSTDSVSEARLQELLDHLENAGVVNGGSGEGYVLVPPFDDFLNPDSCYYKGGTLRLMEMAPPCAAQSWEALARENKPAESRMDETIKSPDLSETYAFALHMDAQGAGADAALAFSGLLNASACVLDLAGGAGSYSITPALHLPEPRFFLLEQYPMTSIAVRWIKQHAVEENVQVIEGNMFELSGLESVVSDIRPDTVFASNIFHDWPEHVNLELAKEVFATLPEEGRFILHEMPLSEDGISCDIAAGFSETLRIWTEGMQYKLSEMKNILHRAGFREIETRDSLGPYKFIVGTR